MSAVVIDVGCLECGIPSEVLGFYGSTEEAQAAHPDARPKAVIDQRENWRGQSVLVIFTPADVAVGDTEETE